MENEALVGIPPEAVAAAKDTLGGAVAAAKALPADSAAKLLSTARDGFVYAFEITAAISAIGSLVAAVLAAKLLRRAGERRQNGD
jgi:DHA2 family multidrug resistance protein-like MFS transporter